MYMYFTKRAFRKKCYVCTELAMLSGLETWSWYYYEEDKDAMVVCLVCVCVATATHNTKECRTLYYMQAYPMVLRAQTTPCESWFTGT